MSTVLNAALLAADISILIWALHIINTMTRDTRTVFRLAYINLVLTAGWHGSVLISMPVRSAVYYSPLVYALATLALFSSVAFAFVVNKRRERRPCNFFRFGGSRLAKF